MQRIIRRLNKPGVVPPTVPEVFVAVTVLPPPAEIPDDFRDCSEIAIIRDATNLWRAGFVANTKLLWAGDRIYVPVKLQRFGVTDTAVITIEYTLGTAKTFRVPISELLVHSADHLDDTQWEVET